MMCRFYQAAVITGLLVLGACASCATRRPEKAKGDAREAVDAGKVIALGERLKLWSDVLGEERQYWVYLPASYHNKEFAPKRYPVLYLLDGASHFQSASGVVQFMGESINSNIQIPELIVVALPNTERMRDLSPTHSMIRYYGKEASNQQTSGGGDKFLDFMEKELMPRIEQDYRTEPYRILVGHSLGGLFSLSAFLRRPGWFQAHIAIDPAVWWDDRVLLRWAKEKVASMNALNGAVYIAMANDPGREDDPEPTRWKRTNRELAEFLSARADQNFRTKFQYFEDENHVSLPLIALYHGLRFTFDGYNPRMEADRDPALLEEHFAAVSARMGFEVKPPEIFVNSAAWGLLRYDRSSTTAMEWLRLNARNYPGSPNVYAALGEAYLLKGRRDLAIEYYERSLQLWPENQEAVERYRAIISR